MVKDTTTLNEEGEEERIVKVKVFNEENDEYGC